MPSCRSRCSKKLLAVNERKNFRHVFSDLGSLITVAANTGLRLGELLALEWDCCDFKHRQIHVCRSNWQGHIGTPKSGKDRYVPMNDAAFNALQAEIRVPGSSLVWPRVDGSTATNGDFGVYFERVLKRAGFRKIGWHTFRHSFATLLAKTNNVSVNTIKELMGHASITTTQRYFHHSQEHSKRAVDLLC